MTEVKMQEEVTFSENNSQHASNAEQIAKSMLDLDDDSLLYILKLVPLRDRLSFVCAHDRFIQAFQLYAKANLKELTEYDLQHLTPLEIRYFFEVAGEYLETLTMLAGFEQYSCKSGFDLIKLYCSNLKKLSLWGNLNENLTHFERFRELLKNKPKLKTLRLQRLSLSDDFLNLMLEPGLPKLEHLSIVYCNEFTGDSLKNFTKLKKLRLENLRKLSVSALNTGLSSMPDLYALSFLEAEQSMTDENGYFVEVLNNLPNFNTKLEILDLNMHNTRNVRASHLPCLKHFTYGLRDNNWQTTIELTELLNRKSETLESLRIISFWDFQFNIEQCQLISQFKNLKKLHLPWKDLSKHGIVIDDEALRCLCTLQNLVEFKACGENNFTKAGLLELVRCCKKLKWVNIQCSLIDNKFANELMPVIEEEIAQNQWKRPNGRITFLVYGTKMNKLSFPEAYKSNELKQWVEFIFDELFSLEAYNNLYDDFEHDSNFIRTPFCSYC